MLRDEVKALRLQQGGTNEIYLRLGGTKFPSSGVVKFSANGQGRSASAFGSPRKRIPSTGLLFQVWEYDGVLPDDRIEPFQTDDGINCDLQPGQTRSSTIEFRDKESLAIYEVEMEVLGVDSTSAGGGGGGGGDGKGDTGIDGRP